MSCDCEGMQQIHVLNDLLQRALDQLNDCLSCSVLGKPGEHFISHTAPPDDCCDFLAGWVERIALTDSFPNEYRGGQPCPTTRMWRLSFRLMRPCYPTVNDSATNPFPGGKAIQEAAEKLLIDGNVLWCCVDSGFNGEFAAESLTVVPEKLEPRKPMGGCAGWTLTVVMELDACC